jgi:hypothetical protein
VAICGIGCCTLPHVSGLRGSEVFLCLVVQRGACCKNLQSSGAMSRQRACVVLCRRFSPPPDWRTGFQRVSLLRVRTLAKVALGEIAIHAKQLVAVFGPALISEPFVEGRSALFAIAPSLIPIVVQVIDGEEGWFGFSATRTFPAVCLNHLEPYPPTPSYIDPFSVFGVFFRPLSGFCNYVIPMFFVVAALSGLRDFWGSLSPSTLPSIEAWFAEKITRLLYDVGFRQLRAAVRARLSNSFIDTQLLLRAVSHD